MQEVVINEFVPEAVDAAVETFNPVTVEELAAANNPTADNQVVEAAAATIEVAEGADSNTAQYRAVAEEFGIELPEGFAITEDEFKDKTYNLIAEGVLKNERPDLHEIFKSGLDVEEYVNTAMQYKQILNLGDAELYAFNAAQEQVTLRQSQQEFKSDSEMQEAYDEAYKLNYEKAQAIPDDAMAKLTAPIRKEMEGNLKDLPGVLKRSKETVQLNAINAQVEASNSGVEKLTAFVRENFDKQNVLPIKIDNVESEKFALYLKENLTATNKDGSVSIPFFERLKTDEKHLAKVMQLAYLVENGGLNGVKNSIKNSVINQLVPLKIISNGDTSNEGLNKKNSLGIDVVTVDELAKRQKK